MPQSLTLAITTIEDLLLNHRLTDSGTDQVGAVDLSIPVYQRPYKWTEKNAIQLLDDIVDAKGANRERYRVGTLILNRRCREGSCSYDIVDGQQRIITFSLLLSAFGENVDFLDRELADNAYNRRNVPGNFHAFERRVGAIDDERERAELRDYVKKNCELIVVITDELAEAFQFFDSQNARGKKLYPHDLLKAYHLREMRDLDANDVEGVVRDWEDLDQGRLSLLFSDYLYCIKRWVRGNRAFEFSERDIQMFKGIGRSNNYPYAQYFKGAYSYARTVNDSTLPFVAGMQGLRQFQLDAPIIAGRPFFEYAGHYYGILSDIRNNDKYEGYYINDNQIVKTLDSRYSRGVGNRVARRLFDTAVLLYVDRFCPEHPGRHDMEMFDEFVKLAFVWAYSLRAQYANLGWWQAQNYVMGTESSSNAPGKKNSFNIYRQIVESDSPRSLLSSLSEKMHPLQLGDIREGLRGKNPRFGDKWDIDKEEKGVFADYLHFFKSFKFLEGVDEG